jgi:hypothetical protein
MASSASFSFNFEIEGQPGESVPIPAARTPPETDFVPPVSGCYCIMLEDYASKSWGAIELQLRRGDVVKIDWKRSLPGSLCVSADGANGFIPPRVVQMLKSAADAADTAAGAELMTGLKHWIATANVRLFDSLVPASAMDPGGAGFGSEQFRVPPEISLRPHFSAMPLVLEPGLDSLIWPLRAAEFTSTVQNKQALVVHGGEARLRSSEIISGLEGLSVPALIRSASRTIVWMKTAGPMSVMQNLADPPPEVALACYNAGHSIYFNPSMEFQERWIGAIAADLGHGFGAALDGGIGGDVEVFAVRGRHVTPWHFDAQVSMVHMFCHFSPVRSFTMFFVYSFAPSPLFCTCIGQLHHTVTG